MRQPPVCSLRRAISASRKIKRKPKIRRRRQNKKKNHKTIFKWVCGILAAWLVILAVGGWWLFGSFITAANSIEKLEDGLYAMEYNGDYGFDDFLAQGSAASDSEAANYLASFLSHGFYKVDEAIALLRQYDMNSSIGSAHHLSIADAGGKSVVVEYVDGEMLVTETKVVTNHYLADCEKQGAVSEQSHIRFDALSAYSGPADEMDVRDMLESVAQKNYPQTEGSYEKAMWSIVYCPLGRCADFYFAENYEHSYGLLLHEKGCFVKRQGESF